VEKPFYKVESVCREGRLSAAEFAGLKQDIESKQAQVDRAFARLDDFVREREGRADPDPSARRESDDAKEKLAITERVMEAMSRLNASYKIYVKMLEERIGF